MFQAPLVVGSKSWGRDVVDPEGRMYAGSGPDGRRLHAYDRTCKDQRPGNWPLAGALGIGDTVRPGLPGLTQGFMGFALKGGGRAVADRIRETRRFK